MEEDRDTHIDFSTVVFLKQEYFTEVTGGERKKLDVVAKVGLKAEGDEFILIQDENEASRKDENFPMRMYLYYGQLFARYKATNIPIAFFTDDAKWRETVPDHFEIALPTKTFLRFDYHLIKLKHLDYRRFLETNNPLAFALMAKMDCNTKDRMRLKADFLRLILGTGVDPARKNVLIEYVETYMPLNEQEAVEFKRIVCEKEEYQEVVKMITTYEQDGIDKGIERGERETLIRLIERKFGSLEKESKERILQEIDRERIKSLLLAVLDAQSIDDLEI